MFWFSKPLEVEYHRSARGRYRFTLYRRRGPITVTAAVSPTSWGTEPEARKFVRDTFGKRIRIVERRA